MVKPKPVVFEIISSKIIDWKLDSDNYFQWKRIILGISHEQGKGLSSYQKSSKVDDK